MGQTSKCIEWGIDHGLDGKGAIPNFTERLNGYDIPYIDGYEIGFRMRKAGITERGKETPEQRAEEDRIFDLMRMPRYPHRTILPPANTWGGFGEGPLLGIEVGIAEAEDRDGGPS